MRFLLLALVVALVLLGALWIRLGRPGADRLPPRLRALARRVPLLLLPMLGAATLWWWLRPAPPRGLGKRP